jgi:hypothetical protein
VFNPISVDTYNPRCRQNAARGRHWHGQNRP